MFAKSVNLKALLLLDCSVYYTYSSDKYTIIENC